MNLQLYLAHEMAAPVSPSCCSRFLILILCAFNLPTWNLGLSIQPCRPPSADFSFQLSQYRQLNALIPTPRHLVDFSEAAHEYFGIAYYRLRGWL